MSPAYEIVFMISETSQILFRQQINSDGPNTEPCGTPDSTFSSWRYTLPHRCSRHRMQIAPQIPELIVNYEHVSLYVSCCCCSQLQDSKDGRSCVMKFKCKHFWWFSQLGFSRGEESSLNPGMLVHSLFLISAQQAESQAAHFL